MDRPALGFVLGALLALPAQGAFTELQRLQSFHSQSGDQAGSAVAISADVGVVCAEGRTVAGNILAGECVLYRLINGSWETNGVLLPSVPVTGGRFGESAAMSGDRMVVGAGVAPFCCPDPTDPGRAFVFHRVAVDAWVEEAMLLPTAGDN
ncbi:MAG TPA: hypothetical protein VFO11_12145, partial [Candidatus Polarisedimenticolaceae bacterium]|nr:hypothetical protein [Candidatus Polarisedimenticolaceae bacterium]